VESTLALELVTTHEVGNPLGIPEVEVLLLNPSPLIDYCSPPTNMDESSSIKMNSYVMAFKNVGMGSYSISEILTTESDLFPYLY
jgi:hypothetical protein